MYSYLSTVLFHFSVNTEALLASIDARCDSNMLVNQRWYQSSDIIFGGRVVLCSSKQFSHRLLRETSSAHLQHAKIFKLNLKNFMLPHLAQNITQMKSFWRILRNIFTLTKQLWSVPGENEAFLQTPHCVSWLKISLERSGTLEGIVAIICLHSMYFCVFVFALTCNGVSEFQKEPMRGRALTVSFNSWGRCVDKTSDQNREQWLALFPFKSEL